MVNKNYNITSRTRALLVALPALILLAGCHQDQWVQPKVKPLEPSDFFPDGQSSRQLVPHSVDRDHFWTDGPRYTGYQGNALIEQLPIQLTREDLKRGEERYEVFCSPCHGRLGNGQGMIAMRGFSLRRQPASYQTDKLRNAPIGHFYDVITNGFGTMYSYASRIEPDDRWRIAAFIRALQRSQNARDADIPANLSTEERKNLETAKLVPAINPTTGPGAHPAGSLPTPAPGEPNGNGLPGQPAPAPGTIGDQGQPAPQTPSGAPIQNNGTSGATTRPAPGGGM